MKMEMDEFMVNVATTKEADKDKEKDKAKKK